VAFLELLAAAAGAGIVAAYGARRITHRRLCVMVVVMIVIVVAVGAVDVATVGWFIVVHTKAP